jgi:hypothetical protein
MLSAHPEIVSFPETHFFSHIYTTIRIFRYFKIASLRARKRLIKFLKSLEQEEMEQYIPLFRIFGGHYAEVLVEILDTLTIRSGGSLWIEKTPGHLHFIKDIERLIKDSRFIHIIRTGTDVIASLFEVTHKYPECWGGARDLEDCVKRWIVDIEISQKHLHKSNHTLVRYEELIKEPHEVLGNLCEFIGVQFNKRMLEKYMIESRQLILNAEKWKEKVDGNILNEKSDKFYKIFNEDQMRYIFNRLIESGIGQLEIKPEIGQVCMP